MSIIAEDDRPNWTNRRLLTGETSICKNSGQLSVRASVYPGINSKHSHYVSPSGTEGGRV